MRTDLMNAVRAPRSWAKLVHSTSAIRHNITNSPIKFIYPLLALFSATFHSRLKTELFKLSYPDSTPAPRRTRPPSPLIVTVAPRCLLGLTFPDFPWHRNETRSTTIADLI